MLQISQVVSKAEAMFGALNEHFYNGELPTPAITVAPDGGRGALGWITTAQVWRNGEDSYYELNVCAEYLDRPLAEVARTILHEMAHLYNKPGTKRPDDIRQKFKATITPHYFRHNYVTLLYEAGIDPLIAMRLVGHTDYQTTASIYTHLKDESLKKAATNIDGVFSKRSAATIQKAVNSGSKWGGWNR